MYNAENVARRIKQMGVKNFIELVSSPDFSDDIKNELEQIHVFINGYPCISEICRLAAL